MDTSARDRLVENARGIAAANGVDLADTTPKIEEGVAQLDGKTYPRATVHFYKDGLRAWSLVFTNVSGAGW